MISQLKGEYEQYRMLTNFSYYLAFYAISRNAIRSQNLVYTHKLTWLYAPVALPRTANIY